MKKHELLSIIRAQRADSLGVDDGDLSSERATALDHYHGRPYGNEQEGRSQVVSKDLSEAVDWALPAIMRVFTQSGNIAEFEPVGPEDEAQAQQESDYANTVIMRDNNGFLLLHDACKDALLLKNGYVKHCWVEEEKISEENYSGLTLDEINRIITDLEQKGAEVEIEGQEETVTEIGGVRVSLFDIKLKVKEKAGRLELEAVPTEEVRVSSRCRGSLQDSPFTEHVTIKRRSDLVEMGMPRDFVEGLTAYSGREDGDSQKLARDSVTDESENTGQSYTDRSMDEIEYCEAYIRVDFDGDGIAELRKVVTVADKMPPGEQWNESIPAVPMTSFVPKRIPHRHVGESLDDDLADLQEIKTVLVRQMLDNVYQTNNQQWLVNERVNLKDFMQSLPGGIKRVRGEEPVNGSASPVTTAPILGQILPAIDYFDGMKEGRTGINKATTGLDPDVLKQSTKGAFIENVNRASQKIEMIARMLAETGVKEMVKQVHGILLRHQDKARMVKLQGKYVPVNPREWKERNDLVVKVGLGTGTEEEKREKLMLLVGLQEKLAGQGLIGPQHAYAMFVDVAKTLGQHMPEKYAAVPFSEQHQQLMKMRQDNSQQNMLADAEKVKGQFELMKVQHNAQLKQLEGKHKQEMELLKMRYESMEANADRAYSAAMEQAKLASKEAIEAAKLEMQAFLEGFKTDIGPGGFGTMPSEEQV